MIDHSQMALGKLPVRKDERTLCFARFARTTSLPVPFPAYRDWTPAVPLWPMLGNDIYGDCAFAGALHLDQSWSDNSGQPFLPITADAIAAYSAVCGFNPANPATDRGANLLDVLNYWRQTGIANRKILAYVSVNMQNEAEVKQAINLFGGVYIGLDMPLAWQTEAVWDAPASRSQGFFARLMARLRLSSGEWTPGGWGGHCVPIISYSPNLYTAITWGAKKIITKAGLTAFADEGYAVLSQDWISSRGTSPAGFDLAALRAALAEVAA